MVCYVNRVIPKTTESSHVAARTLEALETNTPDFQDWPVVWEPGKLPIIRLHNRKLYSFNLSPREGAVQLQPQSTVWGQC